MQLSASAAQLIPAHRQQLPPHLQQQQQHEGLNVNKPSGEPYWSSGREQQCCLVENGRRCTRPAGNASYSKRIQKTVVQRKLKLHMDNSVSFEDKLNNDSASWANQSSLLQILNE